MTSTCYFSSLGSKASLIPVRHLFICFDVGNRFILKEQKDVYHDQNENERLRDFGALHVPRSDICEVSIQVVRIASLLHQKVRVGQKTKMRVGQKISTSASIMIMPAVSLSL